MKITEISNKIHSVLTRAESEQQKAERYAALEQLRQAARKLEQLTPAGVNTRMFSIIDELINDYGIRHAQWHNNLIFKDDTPGVAVMRKKE